MRYDVNDRDGCRETNGVGREYHDNFNPTKTVDWTHEGLTVTRMRLLSDPGFAFWDVSYCHGVLKDGTQVRVELPFDQLPKANMYAFLFKQAKRTGKFIKGLNSCISTLN